MPLPDPGLTVGELFNLTEYAGFQERLGAVAFAAADLHAESAFAVYRKGANVLLSEVVYPTEAERAAQVAEEAFTGLPSRIGHISVERLLHVGSAMRTDVLVLIHGHPLLNGDNVVSNSFPSAGDLEYFIEAQAANPGIIEGVLAARPGMATSSLFLYKADPRRNFRPHALQGLSEDWALKRTAMQRAGLRSTDGRNLRVQNRSGRVTNPDAMVSGLFGRR